MILAVWDGVSRRLKGRLPAVGHAPGAGVDHGGRDLRLLRLAGSLPIASIRSAREGCRQRGRPHADHSVMHGNGSTRCGDPVRSCARSAGPDPGGILGLRRRPASTRLTSGNASHTGTVARACQLKGARQHLQAPLTSLVRPGLHFTQPPDIRGHG